MIEMDQMPQLPVNTGEKHIACVVLVDTSGSMVGASIRELNEGLKELARALQEDVTASGCADVAVVSFNSTVSTVVPFCPAYSFNPPELTASGMTAMNEAIITGLDILEERKMLYRQYGTPYFRPWMFLLTDGAPTDSIYESAALQRIQEAIQEKKVTFWPMGIGEGADINRLKKYANGGAVFKATASQFKEAFVWLSNSMSVIGNSDGKTQQINLPPTPPVLTVEL